MFGSIRSLTTAALAGLEHIARQSTGVLFMPYAAGQIASLRGLIATWLRLAIFEAMNEAEGDQRLWAAGRANKRASLPAAICDGSADPFGERELCACGRVDAA